MANNKYNQLKRQYSLDGGLTWHDLLPMVYKVGNVIETNSDCVDESGCRWVILPISEAYDCDSNYNLYQIEAEECLQPNGMFKRTGNIRRYQLVDTYSVLCGYTGITCTPSVRTEYSYSVEYNGGAVEWNQVATPVVSETKTVIETDKGCVETSSSSSTNITNYSITYNPSGDNTNEEDRNVIATVTYNDKVIGSFTYVQKGYVHVNEPTLVGNLIFESDENIGDIYSDFNYMYSCYEDEDSSQSTYYDFDFTVSAIEGGYSNEAGDFNTNTLCSKIKIDTITGFKEYATKLISFPDTSKIHSFSGLFRYMELMTSMDLTNFNTNNVTNMYQMFTNSSELVSLNLSGWNTNNVESISYMFSGCTNLTYLDVSGWELTDKLTDYDYVFAKCNNLRSVIMNNSSCESINRMRAILLFNGLYDVNLTTNVNDCDSYKECSSEENCNNTLVMTPTIWLSYDDTLEKYLPAFSNITKVYFNNISFNLEQTFEPYDVFNAVYSIDITTLNGAYPLTSCDKFLEYSGDNKIGRILCFPDVSNVTSMNRMFANSDGSYLGDYNTALRCVNAKGWNTSNVTDMNEMFHTCTQLEEIIGIEDWDVSNVTDMGAMFANCYKLSSLDLSNWNTSSLTTMEDISYKQGMFYHCSGLTSLNLNGWNTSNVTSMYGMFSYCIQLEEIIGIEDWNVSNVTDMTDMFACCVKLSSLDLSSWNTSNVTDMNGMFSDYQVGGQGESSLISLDLSSWNTSNVTDMNKMFYSCTQLEEIIGIEDWNVSNVTDMSYIFYNCSSLTNLDLSNWGVSIIDYNMRGAFENCNSLTTINLSGWDITPRNSSEHWAIFSGCDNLTTIYAYDCDETTINFLNYETINVVPNATLVY